MCTPRGNLSLSLKIIRSYKLLSVGKLNLTTYLLLGLHSLFFGLYRVYNLKF